MSYLRKLDIKLVKGEFENPLKAQIQMPEQLYDIFREVKDFAHETLFVVYFFDDLTAAYDIHSHGPSAMTLLSLKDLLGRGYMMRARYFALIHNHPKGNPKPSAADRHVISTLESNASGMLELSLLDFIIIGDNSYWSLSEEEDAGAYTLGARVYNGR